MEGEWEVWRVSSVYQFKSALFSQNSEVDFISLMTPFGKVVVLGPLNSGLDFYLFSLLFSCPHPHFPKGSALQRLSLWSCLTSKPLSWKASVPILQSQTGCQFFPIREGWSLSGSMSPVFHLSQGLATLCSLPCDPHTVLFQPRLRIWLYCLFSKLHVDRSLQSSLASINLYAWANCVILFALLLLCIVLEEVCSILDLRNQRIWECFTIFLYKSGIVILSL